MPVPSRVNRRFVSDLTSASLLSVQSFSVKTVNEYRVVLSFSYYLLPPLPRTWIFIPSFFELSIVSLSRGSVLILESTMKVGGGENTCPLAILT